MFSTAIYLKCVKMRYCVVMGYLPDVSFNPLPNDIILDVTKFKAFADDKFNVTNLIIFSLIE